MGSSTKDEPVLNLNYEYVRRLAWTKRGARLGADVSSRVAGALGNLFTQVDIGLEARWGWYLPRGFTHLPDSTGRSVFMEPSPDGPSENWSVFFSVAPRATWLVHTATLDGNSFRGSHRVDRDNYVYQLISGLHIAKGDFGMRYSLFYTPDFIHIDNGGGFSWGNISLEYWY